MRKVFSVVGAIALLVALAGCASDSPASDPNSSTNSSVPTPDANLIPPAAGADVKAIDYTLFDVGYDEYLFKAGDGPVWCTVNSVENWALCEMNEAAAEYSPIPPPSDCQGSYGYQIKLYADPANKPGFICSGGYYSDASVAQTLNSGEKITVGDITCYVNDITARCDNKSGQYTALGPKVWAAVN
jgi:predicted small lipoprotein YifL